MSEWRDIPGYPGYQFTAFPIQVRSMRHPFNSQHVEPRWYIHKPQTGKIPLRWNVQRNGKQTTVSESTLYRLWIELTRPT